MGFSHWSDAAFNQRQQQRRRTNQSAFTYDRAVRESGRVEVHPQMDPFDRVRESRASDAHPNAVAIAVIFDVTGSMGIVPRVLQAKLGGLMHLLLEKGYVADPQLLFGAVGDANCDRVPLQIGQFESGLEMDDELGKIFLEGGGGGQVHETYELALYFMAAHTAIDCFERRQRKGYLFTIGDEKPYAKLRRDQVRQYIGDALKQDVAVEQVVAAVQRCYEYFHIIPTNTSHGGSFAVQDRWRRLLGERVLLLDDEEAVCETIALAIGLNEGVLEDVGAGVQDLHSAGYATATADAAAAAVARAGVRNPRLLMDR